MPGWQGNTLVKKEKYAAALDRYTEALTFYKEPGASLEQRRPAGHIKIPSCGVGQEAAHALTGWEALVGGCRCGCLCSAGSSTQDRSYGARPSSSGHCIGRERGGMSPHSAAHIGPLNACVPTACSIEFGGAPAGHARQRPLRRAALLTNRAFCHKKRGDWGNVEKDSRAALELDGSFLKVPSVPLQRRGFRCPCATELIATAVLRVKRILLGDSQCRTSAGLAASHVLYSSGALEGCKVLESACHLARSIAGQQHQLHRAAWQHCSVALGTSAIREQVASELCKDWVQMKCCRDPQCVYLHEVR